MFQLILGLLKIHSSQSSPQQAVLTIPSQLKPLSVNTSGGVQTILMPVNKGKSFTTGLSHCGCPQVCLGIRPYSVHWWPLLSCTACPLASAVFPGTLNSRALALGLKVNPNDPSASNSCPFLKLVEWEHLRHLGEFRLMDFYFLSLVTSPHFHSWR